MKQVLFRQGKPVVEDVPAPSLEPGTVLVRVAHSCISTGTELGGIASGSMPLWRKALAQPDKVVKAMKMVSSIGISQTAHVIESRLGAGAATGYAAAGTVMQVAADITDFKPGDIVACAGAEWAHHAQFIRVPRNLTSLVPHGVTTRDACTATLGAIALHGVRRANPTLGETVVVLGLGVIGQLTCQILKANGCRALALDPDPERVELALTLGIHAALPNEDALAIDRVQRLTQGHGADAVIITAASSSSAIASVAFNMCRRKGRVVLVGDVGLELSRSDFYAKEIDFLISCSYGPGRYDVRYESQGLDYPLGYVRWSEGRNLDQYLRMLADGAIRVGPLIESVFPIGEAGNAYTALQDRSPRPLLVLLSYPEVVDDNPVRFIHNPKAKASDRDRLHIALVGAGLFAREMHLPNLRKLADRAHLHAVVSRTGHHATDTARRFGAAIATTDFHHVLSDATIDAVIITTRHDTHTPLTLEALRAGKHVLVEKPLALSRAQLDEIELFFTESSSADVTTPLMLTGFNRRFSPHIHRLSELLGQRTGPMMINYRFNAPRLAPDHWVHGLEGGGRNLGEACHIYDLFTALINRHAVGVSVQPIASNSPAARPDENFIATIRFEDGSVASLTYTTLGHSDLPKERMELFADGVAYVLDDYRTLTIAGSRAPGVSTRFIDKGHSDELLAFVSAARTGGDWPIPLWQQIQATRIALDVEDAIQSK